MSRTGSFKGLVTVTAALLAAVACGSGGGGGSAKGTFKIGTDFPVCTVGGQSTQNGVDFAAKKVNDGGGIEGFTVEVTANDDCVNGSYNADKGVQNVQSMISDSKVLGMIGPYNSAVAKAEIPIASAQHFTMISPSNTNPCLTKDLSTCTYHPQDLRKGNPNNYFRVVTTDDYQGPAMADFAYKNLKITKIGVLSDSTVFGIGIADAFQVEFQKLGGTFKRMDYKKDQVSDFRSDLIAFKDFGAGGLYVGGTDDQNACVARSQMTSIGFSVPYFGGDGIETTDCIDQAAGN